MKMDEYLTMIVCTECGEHFLIQDLDVIIKCPKCNFISGEKDMFIPLDKYLEISREWY